MAINYASLLAKPQLSSNSRFLQMLRQGRQGLNNASVPGGLASMLSRSIEGYIAGDEARQKGLIANAIQTGLKTPYTPAVTTTPAANLSDDEVEGSTPVDASGEITIAPSTGPLQSVLKNLSQIPGELAASAAQPFLAASLQQQATARSTEEAFRRKKELKGMPKSEEQMNQAKVLAKIAADGAFNKAILQARLREDASINAKRANVGLPRKGYLGEQQTTGITPRPGITPGTGDAPNMTIPEAQAVATGLKEKAKAQAKTEAERNKNRAKVLSGLKGFERQTELVTDTISRALNKITPFSSGFGVLLKGMPLTEARELDNLLNTVRANIGFDKLQQMRDASPTGGALGQVSEQENILLQATQGALDAGTPGQLRKNLNTIKELYPIVLQEKRAAFETDFGPIEDNKGEGNANQPPKGLDPEIWEAMTPKEKKAFK